MFFFSSRRRHTRYWRDWSSDVCSSDLSAIVLFIVFLLMKWAMDRLLARRGQAWGLQGVADVAGLPLFAAVFSTFMRSEERRVGKECRSGWSAARVQKKVKKSGAGRAVR